MRFNINEEPVRQKGSRQISGSIADGMQPTSIDAQKTRQQYNDLPEHEPSKEATQREQIPSNGMFQSTHRLGAA